MKNLAFVLTVAERDALRVMWDYRFMWRALDTRTLASLHKKGLVAFGAAPALTPAGALAAEMIRLLAGGAQKSLTSPYGSLTRHSSANRTLEGALPAGESVPRPAVA